METNRSLEKLQAELERTRAAYAALSTELEERNAALEFLEDASELLGSSLDYEKTLSSIVDLAVPRMADYCTVDLMTGENSYARLATKHVNPDKLRLTHRLQELLGGGGIRGVLQALRTGETQLTAHITDELWVQSAVSDEHLTLLRELNHRTMLRVPLRAAGRVVGAISFFCEMPNRYTAADVRLAEDLASRASLAIENARLYREARRAEDDLRVLNSELEQRVADRTAALELANHDLDLANRHKREFLANMSHELRTPLSAVISFSEIMLDTPAGDMDQTTHYEFLSNIYNSGKHLLTIINDLLDLSMIETGKMGLHAQVIDLTEIVNTSVMTITPAAEKKQIGLSVECPPDTQAWGDPPRVRQIIINLLSNAVKFTPDQGRVSVSAKLDDGTAVIAVRDTGIGISAENQELIFDEFRQVDQRLSREYEGAGLGLALVRRMVELHGGSIAVESALGEGSCFTVTLPVRHS